MSNSAIAHHCMLPCEIVLISLLIHEKHHEKGLWGGVGLDIDRYIMLDGAHFIKSECHLFSDGVDDQFRVNLLCKLHSIFPVI